MADVLLTGTFTRLDGTPAAGSVKITPSRSPIMDPDLGEIISGPQTFPLQGDGSFSVELPPTNDPALGEAFTYSVTAAMTHSSWTIRGLTLPAGAGTVDLSNPPAGVVREYPTRAEWEALTQNMVSDVQAVLATAETARDQADSFADAAANSATAAQTARDQILTGVTSPDSIITVAAQTAVNTAVSEAGEITDPLIASTITDPTSATYTAVKSAMGRLPHGSLSPVWIETRDTGLTSGSPANLRTGLDTMMMPGGGYTEELQISVTGDAGSNILVSSEPVKVAGLGTTPFAAVLTPTDGSPGMFVTVISNNGVDQITLRHPLTHDFEGTLTAKYDQALGQHLTRAATRAYIQHAVDQSPLVGCRGEIIAGNWRNQPASHNHVWEVNPALAAYGVSNSDSPIIRTNMTTQLPANVLHPTDKIERNPSTGILGVRVGTHQQGHGATTTLHTGAADTVLEFWVSTSRSTLSTATFQPHVTITADNTTLYDQTLDGWLNHITVPVTGYSTVTIDVINNNPTPTPYDVYLSDLTLRKTSNPTPVGRGKIVFLGDSWFGFYDGEAAKALTDITGAHTINRGLGGMTTEWALAWFDEYVVSEAPDECWLHFFTNDLNRPSGTFTAPDGTEQPLWKDPSQTADEAAPVWAANIQALVRRCREHGIRPVVFMPGGTASEPQMAKHTNAVSLLDRAPLVDGYQASQVELADPDAYVNTVGKYPGRRVTEGNIPKYAAGPAPADTWA